MQLTTLVDRYDDRLRTDAFVDIDASANGLQVARREEEIERVAFAVDAGAAIIEAAGAWGADVLVVHHGLVWGGLERVTGRAYDRLRGLIERDMALYVSHLPLDGHQDLGNAAGVADVLGLVDREPFGRIQTEDIGQCGRLREPIGSEELVAVLEHELSQGDQGTQVLAFGPDELRRVGIVTGSGADWLDEAAKRGLDALVTGEGKHQVYHAAREAGVTVVLGGHYATETFGVQSLESLAGDWGLETTFIDHPTGL